MKRIFFLLLFAIRMCEASFLGENLCKKYGAGSRISLLFIIPSNSQCFCRLNIPYEQWRNLVKLYQKNNNVEIKMLVPPQVKSLVLNMMKVNIKAIELTIHGKTLTLICKEGKLLKKAEGNLDISEFREIVKEIRECLKTHTRKTL